MCCVIVKNLILQATDRQYVNMTLGGGTKCTHKIHQFHGVCNMVHSVGRQPLVGGGPKCGALSIEQFQFTSRQYR